MRGFRVVCVFVSMTLTACHVGSSRGDTPALELGTFTTETKQYDETIGWSFIAEAPIIVTQLGAFDPDLDGFVDDHPVGLWTSSGELLVDAIVPSGTDALLEGFFRYVPVSPTELVVGNEYVIGASFLHGSLDLTEGIVDS